MVIELCLPRNLQGSDRDLPICGGGSLGEVEVLWQACNRLVHILPCFQKVLLRGVGWDDG